MKQRRRERYYSRTEVRRRATAVRVRNARHFLVLYLFLVDPIHGFDRKLCKSPLGMESGVITDEQLSASSSYVSTVGAIHGRLNEARAGGGWCPRPQVEAGIREFLEVDLRQVHVITAIATQGRHDKGRGQEYMEEYSIEYYRPRLGKWREYRRWDRKRFFTGNVDTTTIISHPLEPAIVASKIRVLPYSVHRRTVCTRMELYGCLEESGLLSYSVPISGGIIGDLNETTYDGNLENFKTLVGGLGRLTDGQVGADSFTLDIGKGKGTGWVAWKNSYFPKKCIDILFEFSSIRNFTQINIYANNYFSKNVQVFGRAVAFFKIDDKLYIDDPIVFHPRVDLQSEKAKNISITMSEGAIGRWVKLRLYFVKTWLMLGEVYFTSVPIHTNISEDDMKILVDDAEIEPVFDKQGNVMYGEDEDLSGSWLLHVQYALAAFTAIVMLAFISYLVYLILDKYLENNNVYSNPSAGRKVRNWVVRWSAASPDEEAEIDTGDISQSMIKNQLRAVEPDNIEHYSEPISHPKQSVTELTKHGYKTKISTDQALDDGGFNTDSTLRRARVAKTYEVAPEIHQYNTHEKLVHPYYASNVETREHKESKTKIYRSDSVDIGESSVESMKNYNTFKNSQDPRKRVSFDERQPEAGPSRLPRPRSVLDNFRQNRSCMNAIHKLQPGPKSLWNIGASANAPIVHPTGELIPVPLYALSPYSRITSHAHREIRICASDKLKHLLTNPPLMVQVRQVKLIEGEDYMEYFHEVRLLASLSHPGLCNVIGIVTSEMPPLIVQEYSPGEDLRQILSSNTRTLSFQVLIFVTTQICCAMKYLESRCMVHKDLAARNCLIFGNNRIKVMDVAMYCNKYKTDYYVDDAGKKHPLRWMSWEAILLGQTSSASNVWSFAVTAWEVLQNCHMAPYSHLSNEQLIGHLEHLFYGGELQECLPRPKKCPPELYKILRRCWQRDEQDRPTFNELYNFIMQNFHEDLPFEYLL